jgi:6-phospho-beta-glucosidase
MLKVAVMGGGSTYTPELVNGFLDRVDRFPVDELWLADIDETRLAVVGGFAQRMAAAKGARFSIHLTTDRHAAIRDATYVTTQLRVGQMNARRADEYLGLRHGLVGQETTGVGGMAKALRTIPVILDIANDVQELARPGALLDLVVQGLPDGGRIAVPNVGFRMDPGAPGTDQPPPRLDQNREEILQWLDT